MSTLTLHGTTRPIQYTLGQLRDVEPRIGSRSLFEVLIRHGGFFRLNELAVLCWWAWRADEPTLTIDRVFAEIVAHCDAGGDVLAVQQAVTDALIQARLIGPAEENGAAVPPKAPPSA